MHVLCLIDSLAPAGAERSLASLVPHLVSREVSVDVGYFVERPGLRKEMESEGAAVHRLDGESRLARILSTRDLIVRLRPDLVHTTLFEAHVAGRAAGAWARVPVVSSLTGLNYGPDHVGAPSWKLRGAQLADVATARLVTRFHAVAGHVAEAMSRRLRIPRGRIEVIPRGRDPSRLGARTAERRRVARSALGIRGRRPVVIAVARHERKKGLDLLLEAFKPLLTRDPEARLVIVGPEGRDTPTLHSVVSRLGIGPAVTFLGPRADVPDLLCAADVFVLPSRSEGFPGALVEAMALEAPIVATDIPAAREVVGEDGRAAVLVPDDAAALSEGVHAVLSDTVSASERARAARARFLEEFTVDAVAGRMLQLYERAVNGRGGK